MNINGALIVDLESTLQMLSKGYDCFNEQGVNKTNKPSLIRGISLHVWEDGNLYCDQKSALSR